MFDHIIGNEQVKGYLTRISERGTIGNSLLFSGPDGIGKGLFAEAFAKHLICLDDPTGLHKKKLESGNHPDIHVYRPEGKIATHSIDSMRRLSEEVYLMPAESRWKVFIIHEADRMLSYSSNALLKTFEEPPKDAIIILLTSSPESLLTTILSRCRRIFFQPIDDALIRSYLVEKCSKTPEEALKIVSMSQGSLGSAIRLAHEGENPLREKLLAILCQGSVSSFRALSESIATLTESIEEDKKEIETEARQALSAAGHDTLSAAQKHALEKEVEGIVAIHASREANLLFQAILGWYRDLSLLQLGGAEERLIHQDQKESYKAALKKAVTPLHEVQKHIEASKLAIERSTSLQVALETLFLKLNFI